MVYIYRIWMGDVENVSCYIIGVMGKVQIKEGCYLTIPYIFRAKYNLSCNDMVIAGIIFGFSQDGESAFTGSLSYLQAWTGLTKQGIIKILKKLIDKGIIIKETELRNGVRFCRYKIGDKETLPVLNSSLPVVNSVEQGGKLSLMGGGKLSLPNNIDIDNKDNNKESKEKSTPTQIEKKKSSSAKLKKDIVLDSNNRLAAAAEPASRYGKFMKWAVQTIPDCYSTMAMPTENQLATLMSTYGDSAVIDIFETIENRQDIRGKYKSLYLTAKNWLKRDEMKKQ